MADSNQLKRVDPVDLSVDDPFAELINIMGFDPRVPANSAAKPKAAPIAAASMRDPEPSPDDLAIDLEKELLGELVLEEEVSAPALAPAEVAANSTPVAEAMDPYLDVAITAELSEVGPASASDALDQEPLLSDLDFDAAFERELAFDEDVSPLPAANERRVQQDTLSAEDAALLAALDAVDGQIEPQYPVAAQPHTARRPDADLDVPLAEVDIDFDDEQSADFQQATSVDMPTVEPVPYEEGSIDFDDVDEAVVTDPEGLQQETLAKQTVAEEFQPQRVENKEALAVEALEPPPAVASAQVKDELSLEDELNALLGNTVPRAQLSRGYEAPPLTASFSQARSSTGNHANEVAHASQPVEASNHTVEAPSDANGLEFDDFAFDAAFESSLVADEPHAAATFKTGHDDFPDVETVDVPERAVAVTDDLDIPEVAYEDEVRPAPVLDEFESDFAAVFAEPEQPEAVVAQRSDGWNQPAARIQAPADSARYDYAAGGADGATHGASLDRDFDATQGFHFDDLPGSRQSAGQDADPFDAIDYNDMDDEVALPPYVETRRAPKRRIPMFAALIAGVAVLGGIGALALSFGGGGSDAPAIVKADESPIKIRPENPGGTTVPNQDSKVYQTVAGAGEASEPAQPKLITSVEEPVDVTAQQLSESELVSSSGVNEGEDALDGEDEIAAITAKAEDRLQPETEQQPEPDNSEVAAVEPRRVRTMVVRPDGTLVPREDPSPVVEAATQTAPAAEPQKIEAASPAPTPQPSAPPASVNSRTPATVPVAPSRPADQPVNVVGSVGADQVASVNTPTTPVAVAAGDWYMQIASQPSEEAAKSTFQDLSRKHASVLGGRNVAIVKAEIPGKGTFWRVRVPVGSRNDAISLCESYKSAGGSCFVTR